MWESLAKALAAGLSIWEHKEKNKYSEKLLSLRKARYEEENRPMDQRNDAVLDGLNFELRILVDSFAANIGESNTSNKL